MLGESGINDPEWKTNTLILYLLSADLLSVFENLLQFLKTGAVWLRRICDISHAEVRQIMYWYGVQGGYGKNKWLLKISSESNLAI